MCSQGKSVVRDFEGAKRWYRMAAIQGDSSAQFGLGTMYLHNADTVVDENLIRAHIWFNLSAAGGDSRGVEGRRMVENMMTPEHVNDAQRLARVCRQSGYVDC